jgi:hypothetical protein
VSTPLREEFPPIRRTLLRNQPVLRHNDVVRELDSLALVNWQSRHMPFAHQLTPMITLSINKVCGQTPLLCKMGCGAVNPQSPPSKHGALKPGLRLLICWPRRWRPPFRNFGRVKGLGRIQTHCEVVDALGCAVPPSQCGCRPHRRERRLIDAELLLHCALLVIGKFPAP